MIILTVWRECAALNSSCETISIAYLTVEQISAILLAEDNVTPNSIWQFNVALIDRKGALIHIYCNVTSPCHLGLYWRTSEKFKNVKTNAAVARRVFTLTMVAVIVNCKL